MAYQWAFLRNLVEGPLSSQEANLMVRDCWVNNAWDLSIISVTLPKDIVQEILATPIQWYGSDVEILGLGTVMRGSSLISQPILLSIVTPALPLLSHRLDLGLED